MPLVTAVVSSETSPEIRKKLDEGIREAIFQTSRDIGEADRIPDKYRNFYIVVGEDLTKAKKYIHIRLFMLPRAREIELVYMLAIQNACDRLGFTIQDIKFRAAQASDWRGSLGDPREQPEK